jgi:RHS repeat-associated protein
MIQTNSSVTCLYMYDATGNPILLGNSAQATSVALSYDPYGAATRTDGGTNNGAWLDNPYLFHGGTQDRATGQVKFGQRWYNPITGGWTQQDTLNAPLDPANANRYEYAADDPINLGDPTGRSFAALPGVIAGGAAGLAGLGICGAICGGFAAGFVGGFIGSLAGGDNVGDSLINGAIGGAIGGAFGYLGTLLV